MTEQTSDKEYASIREKVNTAAQDLGLIALRHELAQFATNQCSEASDELHVVGHICGQDRISGSSPFGHGTDETVGVAMLLRITAELLGSSSDLFAQGRAYAASALVRQIVEVEYLAWAFETRDRDAERWLRSDRKERDEFFSPRKLRDAAQGKFRGKDYGYHCEMGGHPVPMGAFLLNHNSARDGLLMSDLLGHVGRIWEHLVCWAKQHSHGRPILERTPVMRERFMAWKHLDPLIDLPPPP